jgi:hypothetical protein
MLRKKIAAAITGFGTFRTLATSGALAPDEASYFQSMQPRFVLKKRPGSKMTPNGPEQPLLKDYYNQSGPDVDLRELVA